MSQLSLTGLLLLPAMLLQANPIRVVTEYRGFYQLQNNDGSLGGYATEVVQALFAITGDTPLFEINSWGRSFHEASSNNNVLIYSLSLNPERAELFDCVAELNKEQLFFWALKGNIKQPLNVLDDLRHYRIAVSIASNPDQYLTGQGFTRLFRTSTPEYALSMLYKNRVDMIISVEQPIHNQVEQLGYDVSQLSKVFQLEELNHPLCIAFNRNSDAALRERYRQAFASLQQNGTLAQIRKRWQLDHH